MGNIAQPSVQSLLIELQVNGNALSTGTAFVALTPKGPHLITNRHNVTGRIQDSGAPLSPTGGLPTDMVIVHNRKGQLGQWGPPKGVALLKWRSPVEGTSDVGSES
jgi:hypothetical protein